MSVVKISALTSKLSFASDDLIPIVDVGTSTTKKITGNVLADFSRNNLPLITYFTGAISGTVLTVTSCAPGQIAWNQSVEGSGVDPDTYIVSQLSGTSGGNGTYRVSVSQSVSARSMNVAALYVNGAIKLAADHNLYQQDSHDSTLYNFLIGIKQAEATIHIGDINTNGVSLVNNQEYKVDSALNPGTYMAVAKVDANDNVILGSGNGASTQIRAGGITGFDYGIKIKNGGEIHIPVSMNIGSNQNNQAFGAGLEICSDAAVDSTGGYAGASMVSYRTSDQNGPFGSFVYGARYRGSTNAPAAVAPDDTLMEFGALGWDGASLNGGGELMWSVDGTVVQGTSNPSRAEIFVTRAGNVSQTLGLKVDSNLELTTYGNTNAGGSIVPITDNVYSLGSTVHRWKDIHVGPGTIYIQDTANAAVNAELTVSNGVLLINGANQLQVGQLKFVNNTIESANSSTDIQIGLTASTANLVLNRNVTVASGKTLTFADGSVQTKAAPSYCGSFYSTQTQYVTANRDVNNYPVVPINPQKTAFTFNNTDTDSTNGVSIVSNSRITFAHAGTYNIAFSVQMRNFYAGGAQNSNIAIWLSKNGTDVPTTATWSYYDKYDKKQAEAWNFFITVAAGDYVQLMWWDKDGNTEALYEAGQTTPVTIPDVPSIILTVNQVK